MMQLDREPAFVLKRSPYKENQYLLDLFTLNHGKLRAVARIHKQKTHRETEHFAPFRELAISGQQKGELATLWQSDILQDFTLHGKDWLSLCYLNELLLLYAAPEADSLLYQYYQTCLQQPNHQHLRHLEYYLIQSLGIIPERESNSNFYQLHTQHDWIILKSAKQGFTHELVSSIENHQLPLDHPQLTLYLQSLLQHHGNRLRSKSTAHDLIRLLRS